MQLSKNQKALSFFLAVFLFTTSIFAVRPLQKEVQSSPFLQKKAIEEQLGHNLSFTEKIGRSDCSS